MRDCFVSFNQMGMRLLPYLAARHFAENYSALVSNCLNDLHHLISYSALISDFPGNDGPAVVSGVFRGAQHIIPEKEWKFWLLQFQDFVQLTVDTEVDLLKILRLYLTASTFEYVQDCKSYDEAIAKPNEVHVKLKNVNFARSCQQGHGIKLSQRKCEAIYQGLVQLAAWSAHRDYLCLWHSLKS
ncbi:hypothetical protein T10_8672 [Trichinella papuae]|uniref:Uncharacterized protein n=1 Tax=Trichinella papuae TaxID=268474 RepID=A0A0V1MX46_9BILA|nr:hypothetical protein T10_8672 [Trichinella papuae]